MEDSMNRRLFSIFGVVCAALFLTPAVEAQSSQLIQGTQVRITLVSGLSTRVAHDGDPFTAVVAEPVFIGSQMVLPAGTKIHGQVSSITRPKLFSMIRGGASMNLTFRSFEIDSRIFPAQMSILALYNGGPESGKQRKDLKTVEGVVIEEKHDVKTDVLDVSLGTGGGSLVGAIFSHVVRGTVIGLVGSSAYIVAKKGKDVDLPAQTGMLVRMDSTIAFPAGVIRSASYTQGDK
jgi:hypothetical protein